jgi:hypothetical protein
LRNKDWKVAKQRNTKAQICRYVEWAKAAGIDVGGIEISPSGSVKIIAKGEEKADGDAAKDTKFVPWD